jgi:hypothetical protein
MAVRYQKARLAIAAALAASVVGGTAYFAEASAPATESASASATGSPAFTVQTTTRQQPATTTRVKRSRSS